MVKKAQFVEIRQAVILGNDEQSVSRTGQHSRHAITQSVCLAKSLCPGAENRGIHLISCGSFWPPKF